MGFALIFGLLGLFIVAMGIGKEEAKDENLRKEFRQYLDSHYTNNEVQRDIERLPLEDKIRMIGYSGFMDYMKKTGTKREDVTSMQKSEELVREIMKRFGYEYYNPNGK